METKLFFYDYIIFLFFYFLYLCLCTFFYLLFSKNGSTLRTFIRSNLVLRVTLIVLFVWTIVIVHGSGCLGSLLCGVYHLSRSMLYNQLRNHYQFRLNFHRLYFDQFGVAWSLLFFPVSYERYIKQHISFKYWCSWRGF